MGSGDWGLPYLPPLTTPGNFVQDPAPLDTLPGSIAGPRFNNQTGSRYGAHFEWKGVSLSGALLETESDSRGIGAARRWVEEEFNKISRDCGGCLEVITVSDIISGEDRSHTKIQHLRVLG